MRSQRVPVFIAISLLAGAASHANDLLRDPMRPYVAPVTKATVNVRFKVNAIFVSDERRVAILNGRRVYQGDQVDGATVTEILADSVRLNYRDKPITARMASSRIRQQD